MKVGQLNSSLYRPTQEHSLGGQPFNFIAGNAETEKLKMAATISRTYNFLDVFSNLLSDMWFLRVGFLQAK